MTSFPHQAYHYCVVSPTHNRHAFVGAVSQGLVARTATEHPPAPFEAPKTDLERRA